MPLIQLKKVNKAITKHDEYHDALDDLNGAELKEFYNILATRQRNFEDSLTKSSVANESSSELGEKHK